MKHLSPELAQTLFQSTDIPLGVRVEFNYQWSKWIKNIDKPAETPSNFNEYLQSKQSKPSNQFNQPNQTLPGTSNSNQSIETRPIGKTQSALDLNLILQSNQYGASFLKAVSEKKPMNDGFRQILYDAILQYCIEKNRDLSVKDCASLAQQICAAFPEELMVLIF